MWKARVFYNPDGTVRIANVIKNNKARDPHQSDEDYWNESMDKMMEENPNLHGLDWEDVDESTIPSGPDKRRLRGEKGKGIRIDSTIETGEERIDRIQSELDDELDKPNPDIIKVARLQRDISRGDK